ncbi:hypothetical protein COV15_01670 [Candidatus Woesearchaeota archaeon CG10_big_fil_rev_8_21_14_0_10_34_12]|nr:MAG: hypothetical protein COV15_01670 [Candidatus Woesearchaeota archaeon CG10_big_fil_rev_8_21_14_0_10_34_12]
MKLKTLRGNLKLPAFFPDATYGQIRGLDNKKLRKLNVDGVVVNAYHFLKEKTHLKAGKKGGIHNLMKFYKPIISDSGGFQIMSLIHNTPKNGKILDNEIHFKIDNKKIILTPENCIKTQIKIGSDIIMCLDDCTKASQNKKEQEKSVERTIKWAEKCKKEFLKLTKNKKEKPLLFAIIQGGNNKKLRKKCAEKLIKIGFDGYSFGGWPIDNGKLLKEILRYTSSLIPKDKPKYAMGIGKPQDIIECVRLGYNMFDCVIPTREARHKKLYIFTKNPKKINPFKDNFFTAIRIKRKHENSKINASKFCNCELCKNHNLQELHSLFLKKDKKAIELATIHNLVFYSTIMEILRKFKSKCSHQSETE